MLPQMLAGRHLLCSGMAHGHRLPHPYDHLKNLAYQADIALKSLRVGQTGSAERALETNTAYRRALFCFIEHELYTTTDRSGDDGVSLAVKSVLLACVSYAWIAGKEGNLSLAFHLLRCDAIRLVYAFSKDDALETTDTAIVSTLQLLLPQHDSSLSAFLHTYEVLDWICTEQRSLREPSFHRRFPNPTVLEKGLSKELAQQLQGKHYLFQSLVVHEGLRSQSCLDVTRTRDKRDALLSQAVAFENSIESRGVRNGAGYIQVLITVLEFLHGRELLSWNIHECTEKLRCVVEGSTDVGLFNLLGCLLVHTDIDSAIKVFQQAIEESPMQKDTVSNLAECLLQIGKTELAKQLLFTLQRMGSSKPKQELVDFPLCLVSAKLLSNECYEHWRCYLAASLDDDTNGVIVAASNLEEKDASWRSVVATVFALLQGNRPSAAFGYIDDSRRVTNFDGIGMAVMYLYEADCRLELEMDRGACKGGLSLSSLAGLALEAYGKVKPTAELDEYETDLHFHIVLLNNTGLSHLLDGSTSEALHCFRKAHSVLSKSRLLPLNSPTKTLQACFFNLTLLLWNEKMILEALKVWMPFRKFLPADEVVSIFDKDEKMANLLQGLLNKSLARFSCMEKPKPKGCRHVPFWQSTTNDMKQFLLLDIIIIQSAIEVRRKKLISMWINTLDEQIGKAASQPM